MPSKWSPIFKKGDLISIPEDKFSAQEMVIIIGVIEEEGGLYEIYDVISKVKDFYSFDYLESIGTKVG
jgi:hypothetical protein